MSYTVQMGGLWATCQRTQDAGTDGERSRRASARAAENTQDSKILPPRPLGRWFAFLQTGVPLARFFRDAGAALIFPQSPGRREWFPGAKGAREGVFSSPRVSARSTAETYPAHERNI